jgi:hypothetical protein
MGYYYNFPKYKTRNIQGLHPLTPGILQWADLITLLTSLTNYLYSATATTEIYTDTKLVKKFYELL